MSQSADNPTGFKRKPLLRHPEVLIESICSYCGLSIIASAPDSLDDQEREHRKDCTPPSPSQNG